MRYNRLAKTVNLVVITVLLAAPTFQPVSATLPPMTHIDDLSAPSSTGVSRRANVEPALLGVVQSKLKSLQHTPTAINRALPAASGPFTPKLAA